MKRTIFLIINLLFLSGTYFLLLGKQSEDEGIPQTNPAPDFLSLFFKTIMLLGFIIILIYGIIYILNRFVYRKNFGKSSNSIEILEFKPIVAKKSMCVVKVVDQILKIAPDRIVYVSCNPATQARDVELLAGSYEVMKIQAVDMFPHTHHVVNIALLKLKKIKKQVVVP